MRSQLKRVDGEVTAMSKRIKALDENLAKSEQYIKTSTASLAEVVAMEVERRNNAGDEDEDDNSPLSQFDAQMVVLEGKLLEAKYLAAKANDCTMSAPTTIKTSPKPSQEPNNKLQQHPDVIDILRPPPTKKRTELRRPFPTNK
jgi:hypothetical protein